jgi:hypothetical protein
MPPAYRPPDAPYAYSTAPAPDGSDRGPNAVEALQDSRPGFGLPISFLCMGSLSIVGGGLALQVKTAGPVWNYAALIVTVAGVVLDSLGIWQVIARAIRRHQIDNQIEELTQEPAQAQPTVANAMVPPPPPPPPY